LYIEGLAHKDTFSHRAMKGYALADHSGSNFSLLRYDTTPAEFSAISAFIETNAQSLVTLKVEKKAIVEAENFETEYFKCLDLLRAGNTGPYVFQIEGLLGRIAKLEKSNKDKEDQEKTKESQDGSKKGEEESDKPSEGVLTKISNFFSRVFSIGNKSESTVTTTSAATATTKDITTTTKDVTVTVRETPKNGQEIQFMKIEKIDEVRITE